MRRSESLLAKWDSLPAPREVDVAVAMMQATLHMISRVMFSSDSDEIVDAVESGVNDYQTNVRPRLLDLLHFPEWFTNLVSPLPTRGIFDEFDRKVDRLLTERGRSPRCGAAARDDESGGGMSAEDLRHQEADHRPHGRAPPAEPVRASAPRLRWHRR
jgi:hypothetical protein